MPYTSFYETQNHDTDLCGNLRPSAVQKYMQETANRQMRDSGPTYEELFEKGQAFILSRMAVKIHRSIKQYENIRVETWPSNKDKAAAFTRCYVIYSGDEEVARGLGIWALVDINTKSLLRVSDMDFSNYEMGEPFEIKDIRFRIPKDEMKYAGDFKVFYTLCDCNRHMNNTNYPDLYLSFIPDADKCTVTDYSITYKAEAPLNETLMVEISEPHENENGTLTYFFRTMTGGLVNSECRLTVSRSS
ncbi:MAG: hypothetical protein E7591_06545 [Ruminococcaceae bacterium]|nr:hypothetical protein [Oscillospiraceae bacterium]